MNIPALHLQRKGMEVEPLADALKAAAIAESGIGIVEFEGSVLGGGSKHERNDPRLLRIEGGILLEDGEDVGIGLESEDAARFAGGESDGERGVASVRANINGDIAG